MKKKKLFKAAVALCVFCALVLTAIFGCVSVMKTLYPLDYDNFVQAYADEYNLEKAFVFSVIKCESNFDPNAVSSVEAKGLMQIMPETFTWLKTKTGESLPEKMLFDPETSIKYGCLYYELLVDMFGDEATAVAAYHAGLGNVSKWLKDEKFSKDGKHLSDIPFSTTKAYVERVMKTKAIYQKLYKL